MKAAFTLWNNRISPVFDVAGQVLVVEATEKHIVARQQLAIPDSSTASKLAFLQQQKIDVLVCGAISRFWQCAVEAKGIKVYPFCSGEVSELISAWLENALAQQKFAMPGCGRARCRQERKKSCCRADFSTEQDLKE